ncbi:Asp23/Gls24 family envelope stress response protein [Actinomadura rayongensis]|uniref:Asp23/Gls24 family envelope stress response protein n=1 Tax=Actinomadura rayongensis TaxID=1429076 RepID=A0A6I4W0W5_9ACTN|nr:Asp23/Gls24 family envelope stress response protein [Actinomadura rayongensis]MXQ62878.1 Asp23/Gls24 family envelope stress response protein [Actinomadura rayongensis]
MSARGVTVIADRVLVRLAEHAARCAEATGERDVRLLGVPRGRRAAKASVEVQGHVAEVRVEIAVVYPEPVRLIARDVRERVRREIEDTTGHRVKQVDVVVSALDRTRRREPAGVA